MQANSTIALLESLNLYHKNCRPTCDYKITKNLSPDLCGECEECSICFNTIQPYNHITPCGHKYHINCLFFWLKHGTSTCPLCRTPLESNSSTELTSISIERMPAANFLGNYGNGPNSRTVYFINNNTIDNEEQNFVGDSLHLIISE